MPEISNTDLQSPYPVIEAVGLTKHYTVSMFRPNQPAVRAVDGIDFSILPGETLGLVGESGCGKSTVARLLVRLVNPTSGAVLFMGADLTEAGRAELRRARTDIQIVFQDPHSSLNPRMTAGQIIAEPLLIHGSFHEAGGSRRVRELLDLVGLDAAHEHRLPHQFSGGQRQRIGIARALAHEPKLIILDEPVSSLDVSIQAQIITLLTDLQKRLGMAYLFISHDLSVLYAISDRVAVMYLGKIVEIGPRDRIYHHPAHPYTQALLSAVPLPDPDKRSRGRIILEGEMPSATSPPSGCRFRTRCWQAEDLCADQEPQLESRSDAAQLVACHFPSSEVGGA